MEDKARGNEIELEKVSEHGTIGRTEPDPLMNNKSAEDTKICTTEPDNINSFDTEKFKEEVSENMQNTRKDKGNTHAKEEDKKKYSNTIEPDRKAKMVSIKVQHH